MYKEYLKYVLDHKKNVFKTCWKRCLYLHAFTHDLSKFSSKEFKPYAEWFYGYDGVKIKNNYEFNEIPVNKAEENLLERHKKCKQKFDKAWEHHYKNNKHHWNYWIGQNMPKKYVIQMICDWEAMSLKFGDTAQMFYVKNYDKLEITYKTRMIIEKELGLILNINGPSFIEFCNSFKITMEEGLERLDLTL